VLKLDFGHCQYLIVGLSDHHDVFRWLDVGGEGEVHDGGYAFAFEGGVVEFYKLEGVSAPAIEFGVRKIFFGCE